MSRLFHARQKLQKALADCYKEQIGPHREGPRSNEEDHETADSEEEEGRPA